MKKSPQPVRRMGFSVLEAAEASDLSVGTIYNRIRDGSLPSSKVGRRRIIQPRDLRQLIEAARDDRSTSD